LELPIDDEVRRIVSAHGCLVVSAGLLSDDDDLFRAGMKSHANVNVMLALEETFGIEFPDDMLRRNTFKSLATIRDAVTKLMAASRVASSESL
jgi:acyl carrier protein